MKKIFNSKKGFTLIELLAVMIVLIAVSSIIGAILFSSLRGTNKTNTLTAVRQNGNNAISQMVKMLRGAKRLDSPASCSVPLSPTPIPTYSFVTFTSFDDGQTTFSCDSGTISSNAASLLDLTGVSLVSCSFTCTQEGILDFPTVGINFSLREYAPSGITLFSEKTASATAIPFQTSVSLRNLKR